MGDGCVTTEPLKFSASAFVLSMFASGGPAVKLVTYDSGIFHLNPLSVAVISERNFLNRA